jgi:hypothetical protein
LIFIYFVNISEVWIYCVESDDLLPPAFLLCYNLNTLIACGREEYHK